MRGKKKKEIRRRSPDARSGVRSWRISVFLALTAFVYQPSTSVPCLSTSPHAASFRTGIPKSTLFQAALYSSTGGCYLPSQFCAEAAAEDFVRDEDLHTRILRSCLPGQARWQLRKMKGSMIRGEERRKSFESPATCPRDL